MADTYDVVNITECKFEQLVRKNAGCVREAKERMISENGSQAHCSRVQDGLMAETAETGMTMYYFYLFSDDDVSEYREEREYRWHCRFPVYDEKGYMVDFESICKVSHTGAPLVGMGDDYDFVSPVDEFRGQLVYVAFNSSWKTVSNNRQ